MKKLLQINCTANVGSTGRIAEEIGQQSLIKGWESYIAYGRSKYISQSKIIKVGNKFDLILHGIKSLLFDRHGLGSKHATKKFIKKIIEIKPDIIHIHNIHGYYINYQVLFDYLKTTNIPIVWTLHDCWSFTGHCAYFDFAKCNKWKKECGSCPQIGSYPRSLCLDQTKRNFKQKKELFNEVSNMTMIPVSYWLSSFLKDSFLKKYPIKTIHNGIDTDVFKPSCCDHVKAKYKIEHHFIILGVAHRWSPRKGLSDFIELSKQLTEKDVIILVGLNKKQQEQLPNNIIGITHTKNKEELAQLYTMADVYINPTMEDNFPTTNLETLSCGTPVITYKTGGTVEQVSENTGFIVDQGDINSLIGCINTIKQEGKMKYSKACRDWTISKFKKEDRYEEYIKIYDKLLENN